MQKSLSKYQAKEMWISSQDVWISGKILNDCDKIWMNGRPIFMTWNKSIHSENQYGQWLQYWKLIAFSLKNNL